MRFGVTTAYTYNKRNRLVTVTVGGNLKGTYTYNTRQQLVKRVLTNMTPSGSLWLARLPHDVFRARPHGLKALRSDWRTPG